VLRSQSSLHLPLSFGLVLLGGCAIFPQQPAQASPDRPVVSSQEAPGLGSPEAQAQYHVLAGEMAAGRQQPEMAAQEFLKALAFAPDAQLAARATALALAAGREDLALTAARKWHQIDTSSLDAREVITRLTLRAGLTDETFDQCEAIIRDHPGGFDDGFRHVALLLSQEPDKADAGLALMDRLVAQYPKRSGAYRAKALLAQRFNHGDIAETAAREALKLDPQSRDAAMLLAGILVKKGDVTEADGLVDGAVKNAKNAADLRLGYARLLLESNQREAARAQLQKVLTIEPDNGDARLALALLALEEKKLDEADAQLRDLAKMPDKQMDATYFLGRVAELRNQPEQALAQYEKVTSGNQALDAQVRRATMLGKLKRIPEARQIFEQLRRQYSPLESRFYVAEGEMLVDAGQNNEALALYNTALQQDPDDGDLLYARSLAFERLNQIDHAEADLKKILDKTPDDARALNALGYMLTVHTNRYEEAQKLIARAIELSPNDPAVIDSMGWLQFKQGRPKEALPYLQKAMNLFPDPEIAAHLGEVLWSLGDKDQARSVLSGALKDAPDNALLRDTVNRLNQ
jgi:tetratricopeptide (TPR) repeat protein